MRDVGRDDPVIAVLVHSQTPYSFDLSLNRDSKRGSSHFCDVLIFLRSISANTDCADNLAFKDNRDPALKWRRAG